jgi:hypothetical protein
MVAMRLPTFADRLCFLKNPDRAGCQQRCAGKSESKKQHIKKKFKFFCRGKPALEVNFAQENQRMHT